MQGLKLFRHGAQPRTEKSGNPDFHLFELELTDLQSEGYENLTITLSVVHCVLDNSDAYSWKLKAVTSNYFSRLL